MRSKYLILFVVLAMASCTVATTGPTPTMIVTQPVPVTSTAASLPGTETFTPAVPTETSTIAATSTFTPLPTETITITPPPVVESLRATVTADLLSCRYGPGAEYLYLYALKAGANIELVGRTDANDWVWVGGSGINKCWVKSTFLNISGDWHALPVVYPGIAKLPITPYYPASSWASATRKGDSVAISWEAVPISPGKYEDENMHQYIVEVWRCEDGQIVFETLGTNSPFLTVQNDEAGCATPSHGNVWVQEKHGYAGPTKVPWPPNPGA